MNIDHGVDAFDPTDPQVLLAYADGELAAADAARVEAAIARDPALAAVVAGHRALRTQVAAAFAGIAAEPVPAHLHAALHAGDARSARAPARMARRPRWSRREWMAMAASLVVGAALALLLGLPRRDARSLEGASPAALVDGSLVARGALARALDQQLAGAGAANVRMALSFRALDGRYCRAFRLQAPRPLAGVACREGAQWQVSTLAVASEPDATPMRQAASALPAAVLADVDARIDGQSLDAAAERRARAAGWR